MNKICIYFLLFMIYSVIGWIIEVLGKLIIEHKFVNRGFLIGPYCPIYGWGALLMTVLLKKHTSDPITLFILIVVLCSFLEYYTSYFLEKIFKMRWWDYNHFKFNINGRICLETMLPFGFGGLFVMYVASPFFLRVLSNMNVTMLYIISAMLFIVYLIDNILSDKIVSNISKMGTELSVSLGHKYKGVKDNTEMVKELIMKKMGDKFGYLHERVMKAFPHVKLSVPNIKKIIEDKIIK